MDKPNQTRNNAFLRVKKFLDDYHDILILLNLYGVEEAEFMAIFLLLQTAVDKEAHDITVVAADKAVVKEDMSQFIYELCLTGSVQAHQLHKFELSLELDKSLGYLSDANDTDAAGRAEDLVKLLDNPDLTEITAQNIIDAKEKVLAFKNIRVQPKLEIEYKAAETTSLIPDLMDQLDEPKNRIGKLIHSKQKDLIETWDKVSKVGQPTGIRHTSMALNVIDSETESILRKVKATITNGTKTIVIYSSKKGWIRALSLETGNWTIFIEFNNYISQVFTNIGVNENEIVRFTIKLVKLPIPGTTPPENTTPSTETTPPTGTTPPADPTPPTT